MNSDTRKELMKKQRELFDEIENLNKIRIEKLSYSRSVSINDLIKKKKSQYKMITALLKGYEDGKENRRIGKKFR